MSAIREALLAKNTGTGTVIEEYVYDLKGDQSSAHDGTGAVLRSELYSPDGRHVATYKSAALTYHLSDWLGTERKRTNSSGIAVETCTDTPYGMNHNCTGTDVSPMHFTGKQKDTETGNDYFGARYLASGTNLGRFMTPDWASDGSPVPYAKLDNPQTLNLYVYLRNNPLNTIDPDGHNPPDTNAPCNNGESSCTSGLDVKNKKPNVRTLAAQVPPSLKAAIMDSVNASNSPSKEAGDQQGGFHEEGGQWGTDTSGNAVPIPAHPGQVADPSNGEAHIDVTNAVNPGLKDNLASIDGKWHVHPSGTTSSTEADGVHTSYFVQSPSTGPGNDTSNATHPINIVVGAGNKKVYFYNSSGTIGSMKLKDFMK